MTDSTDNPAVQAFNAGKMGEFNKGIVEEFRSNGGKVGGPFKDATLLLLTTTGAKSGLPRLNPLAYFTIGGKIIIIGSKAGSTPIPTGCTTCAPTHVAMSKSALATARSRTMTRLPANCRPKSATSCSRRWSPWPRGSGEYQSKTNRVIPVFEVQQV